MQMSLKKKEKLCDNDYTRYHVVLDEETGLTDVLTLKGTRMERVNAWRRYLFVRTGQRDITQANKIAKAMGFDELIEWRR